MPDKTENYDLTKPRPEEFYDVQVQNENLDKIDAALSGKQNETLTGQGEPTTATVGVIGQHYLDTDTNAEYLCLGHDDEVGYIWATPFLVGSGAKISGVFEVKDYFKVGPDRVYITRRLMGAEADFSSEVNVSGSLKVQKDSDFLSHLRVGYVEPEDGHRHGSLCVFGPSELLDDVTVGRMEDEQHKGHLTVLGQIFARAITADGTLTTRNLKPYTDGEPSIGSSTEKYNTLHTKKVDASEYVSTPKLRSPQDVKFIKFMCPNNDAPEKSTDPLPVEWGGTGANTAKDGLKNLGLRIVDSVVQYWDGAEWKDAEPPGKSYSTFGVRIDTTNSNPATAVTYTDDAVGMTGGASAWDAKPIFKAIRPCVMKNGVVQYYLNPLNFNQKEDGSPATITSETEGDVMIEIPKVGVKITTSGNYVDVKITDNPNAGASGFHYYAHTRSAEGDRAKLYLGAYLGYMNGNKLHSISGQYPTANYTIGEFINFAKAKGAGYDIMGFYPMMLVQCLYLIKYKSLNGQAALGQGCVGRDDEDTVPTGGTNTKGMCYGDQNDYNQMKLFGLEDFWGNVLQFIGGLYCNSDRHILTAFRDFNTTGAGYMDQGTGGFTANTYGWIKKVQGTTELGFVLKESGGSGSTFFSDSSDVYADAFPCFGGDCSNGSDAGPFRFRVSCSAGDYDWDVGARLMYL